MHSTMVGDAGKHGEMKVIFPTASNVQEVGLNPPPCAKLTGGRIESPLCKLIGDDVCENVYIHMNAVVRCIENKEEHKVPQEGEVLTGEL